MKARKTTIIFFIFLCIILFLSGCEALSFLDEEEYDIWGKVVIDEEIEENYATEEIIKENGINIMLLSDGYGRNELVDENGRFLFSDVKEGIYNIRAYCSELGLERMKEVEVNKENEDNLKNIIIELREVEKTEAELFLENVENSFKFIIEQYEILEMFISEQLYVSREAFDQRVDYIKEIFELIFSIPGYRNEDGVYIYYPGDFTVDFSEYISDRESGEWLLAEPDYEQMGYPQFYDNYDEWEYNIILENYHDGNTHEVTFNISNLSNLISSGGETIFLSNDFSLNYHQQGSEESRVDWEVNFSYMVEESIDKMIELSEIDEIEHIHYSQKINDFEFNFNIYDNLEKEIGDIDSLGSEGIKIETYADEINLTDELFNIRANVNTSDFLLDLNKTRIEFYDFDLQDIINGDSSPVLKSIGFDETIIEFFDKFKFDIEKLEMNLSEEGLIKTDVYTGPGESMEVSLPEKLFYSGTYNNLSLDEGRYEGDLYFAIDSSDTLLEFDNMTDFINETPLDLSFNGNHGDLYIDSEIKSSGDPEKSENMVAKFFVENLNEMEFKLELVDNQIVVEQETGTADLIFNSEEEVLATIDPHGIVDFYINSIINKSREINFPFN